MGWNTLLRLDFLGVESQFFFKYISIVTVISREDKYQAEKIYQLIHIQKLLQKQCLGIPKKNVPQQDNEWLDLWKDQGEAKDQTQQGHKRSDKYCALPWTSRIHEAQK